VIMAFLLADGQVVAIDWPNAAREAISPLHAPSPEGGAGRFYSGEQPIGELVVGSTRYPLRRPLRGVFYPARAAAFEYIVEELGHYFVGRADTRQAAFENWRDRVHAAFQRLIRMRPFEMDAEDEARWSTLESVVDVPRYRKTAPITMRQLGKVQTQHFVLDIIPADAGLKFFEQSNFQKSGLNEHLALDGSLHLLQKPGHLT